MSEPCKGIQDAWPPPGPYLSRCPAITVLSCLVTWAFVFLCAKKRAQVLQHFGNHPKRCVLKARRGHSQSVVSKRARAVLSGGATDCAFCSERDLPLIEDLLGSLIPAKPTRVGEAIF